MAEYIEREKLPPRNERGFFLDDDFNAGWNACLNKVNSIPAADVVERKAGKWETDEIGCAICSVCGNYAFETTTHHISGWYPRFCPNCGADMRGEQNGH